MLRYFSLAMLTMFKPKKKSRRKELDNIKYGAIYLKNLIIPLLAPLAVYLVCRLAEQTRVTFIVKDSTNSRIWSFAGVYIKLLHGNN